MATTSVLNKIYEHAAATFDDTDFHCCVGKNKSETKYVFDRFPNDGSDLKSFIETIREGQEFSDLMGVFSCYFAFMEDSEAAKALGFDSDEWVEIKQILRW